MKIILEIELTELKGVGRLHTDGFSMEYDGKNFLNYSGTVPGLLPYIQIHQGPHKGKTFAANSATFMEALEKAFQLNTEPPGCAASCAPGDYQPGGKCDLNGCYIHDEPPMGNPAWVLENGEWVYHPELDTTPEEE